jgi:hypothetical protein
MSAGQQRKQPFSISQTVRTVVWARVYTAVWSNSVRALGGEGVFLPENKHSCGLHQSYCCHKRLSNNTHGSPRLGGGVLAAA